jgi:uncharacterized protein (DUF2345 family)
MSEAKNFASQARQDKELAGSLAQKAEKHSVEAGELAQTTARLKDQTDKLKE